MLKVLMIIPFAVAVSLSGSLAYAKNDGPAQGKKNAGGVSTQHMSVSGRENTNSPVMGQQKGDQRAVERRSDEGNLYGVGGEDKAKGKGKAKGHAK